MSAPPVLLAHPSSLQHDTGPHPEQPARIVAIERELERLDYLGFQRVSSPAVELNVLRGVHPQRHIDLVRRAAEAGGAEIDADTVVSAGSFAAALHAAGGAVSLVDRLLDGGTPTGFSIHRPPGHHAESRRAMGFCLFNNIAVAAQHALDGHGSERVMIVDWDVHHGNGTNDIFADESRVLFTSIHQSPLYPGSGAPSDVGAGEGRGFTVNLPVPPGSGDGVFCSLVADVVVPLARAYSPQLVLISAGFDAHHEDPMADCTVTESGFAAMARSVSDVAAAVGAPVGAVLEGGYALDALARSVAATMGALAGGAGDQRGAAGAGSGAAGPGGAADGPVADESTEALARLAQFWPGLA
jgi:acetoin utilization deacetylase AcuC-like enzyme